MNKYVLVFLLSFLSNLAVACVMPMSGKRYDSQIDVEKLDDINSYQFSIPAEMEGLNDLVVTLGYSKKHESEFWLMEEGKELSFKVLNNRAIGVFTLENKVDSIAYLHVTWWPKTAGLCGVEANS